MNEVTERYNIPLEAVLGGPETMYPEYRKKLKDKYVLPPPCKQFCGGGLPAAGGRGAPPAAAPAAAPAGGRGAAPAGGRGGAPPK